MEMEMESRTMLVSMIREIRKKSIEVNDKVDCVRYLILRKRF